MNIELRSIIGIFTIINSKIYFISFNNDLFNIECKDTFDKVNRKYVYESLKIKNIDLKQCFTFSEKKKDKLVISTLYIDVIDYNDLKDKDFEFICIDDKKNSIYIDKCIDYLRKYLIVVNSLKKIYPNYFTLPEMQKMFENLLGKKLDRRNFRKKLIKLDIIDNLEKNIDSISGRPAKLYKFKDNIDDKLLF